MVVKLSNIISLMDLKILKESPYLTWQNITDLTEYLSQENYEEVYEVMEKHSITTSIGRTLLKSTDSILVEDVEVRLRLIDKYLSIVDKKHKDFLFTDRSVYSHDQLASLLSLEFEGKSFKDVISVQKSFTTIFELSDGTDWTTIWTQLSCQFQSPWLSQAYNHLAFRLNSLQRDLDKAFDEMMG